jgi:hypothetical protein
MAHDIETGESVADVGSLTLLGLACIGALITICAYWILGS